jgi:3-methyl-2-oxobutanoate hydroxymethyltransferase
MSEPRRVTVPDLVAAKGNRRLAVLTAYDYPTALWLDRAGVDVLLVGDSLAMVVLGLEDTLSVGMDEMLHHTRAVARGARRALVVGDMPFMSYQASVEQAVRNAGRFLKEGRAHAVKLEGGAAVLPEVRAIVDAGIPVMGHLGLTPQSAHALGGYRVQGRTAASARKLVDDAAALAEAGCFSIVLEAIPAELAARITEAVAVPTVGIGAGPDCDGQVLVVHDAAGLFERFTPRFVKRYADLGPMLQEAATRYVEEVKSGDFPTEAHSFTVSDRHGAEASPAAGGSGEE